MCLKKQKIYAYTRVSTKNQDNSKFTTDILNYANKLDLGQVSFYCDEISGYRSLKDKRSTQLDYVMTLLKEGDHLIIPELSRLGRRTREIMNLTGRLWDMGIVLHVIKENFILDNRNPSLSSTIMLSVFSLVAELERRLLSDRTKEGVAYARDIKGKTLGRKRGPGKSKLDHDKQKILDLLYNGSTKAYVSERYLTTRSNLDYWLKTHTDYVTKRVELKKLTKTIV